MIMMTILLLKEMIIMVMITTSIIVMMIGMMTMTSMMMVMIWTLTTMMRTMVVGLMMTSNFRLQAPGPSWPHVLRAVLCHGLILPTAIMR